MLSNYNILIKIAFCIIAILSNLTLNANENNFIRNLTQPQFSEIIEITKKNGETFVSFSNIDVKDGESGIIVRNLESYQVIVANIVATNTEKTKAIGKVLPFKQLAQPFLPTPNLIPQVGDKIIFRSFNNKAFIIAPNEENYTAIKEKYPFIEFVSSDLLMGFLNSQGKHDPDIKTLPKACNEYGVGLVFIVGSKNIGILNCSNLKNIVKYKNTPIESKTIQSPFYTRVNFDGGGSLTYSLSPKKSKNYFPYYNSMIGD